MLRRAWVVEATSAKEHSCVTAEYCRPNPGASLIQTSSHGPMTIAARAYPIVDARSRIPSTTNHITGYHRGTGNEIPEIFHTCYEKSATDDGEGDGGGDGKRQSSHRLSVVRADEQPPADQNGAEGGFMDRCSCRFKHVTSD